MRASEVSSRTNHSPKPPLRSNSIFCPGAQQGAKANRRATYPASQCKPGHLSISFLQPPTQNSPTSVFVMVRAVVKGPTPPRHNRVSPEWLPIAQICRPWRTVNHEYCDDMARSCFELEWNGRTRS